MGCSSSSAQTVDQEKRPGTKPEETNGDTLAVKNGISAEDAQTVEAQMQLRVQTALPDDPKAGAENEEEAVLVAMEAQEDLGSGEDLLAASGPQSEPAASSSEKSSAEPDAAVAEVEPVEEVQAEASNLVGEVAAEQEPAVTPLDVEETPAEAASEVPAEATSEASAEAPTEAASEAPAEAPAEAAAEQEPAVTSLVVEETPAEAADDAPAKEASPVQEEETTDHLAPETTTENKHNECSAADEAPTPGVISALNEGAAPTESLEPAGAVEPLIDTAVAAATIPELPSSSAQGEPEHATEEAADVSTAHNETAPPEEALCPTEVPHSPPTEPESAGKWIQILEVPGPAPTASETLSQAVAEPPPEGETSESTAEAHVVENILTQSEGPSAPEPASEPSPEVVPANEASDDSQRETVKKED